MGIRYSGDAAEVIREVVAVNANHQNDEANNWCTKDNGLNEEVEKAERFAFLPNCKGDDGEKERQGYQDTRSVECKDLAYEV